MEYMKPSIIHVTNALVAIQGSSKSTVDVDDAQTGHETISAYESDE